MFRLTSITIAVAIVLLTASTNLYSDESQRVSMYSKYLDFSSHVKGGRVEANWMADGSSFWYADDGSDEETFWKVDPSSASRTPLFDKERLKASLEKALTDLNPERGLPFDRFDFVDGSQSSVRLEIGERTFILDLTTYDLQPAKSAIDEAASRLRMPKEVLLKFRSALAKKGIDANTALERLASSGGTPGISVENLKGKSPQQILSAFAKSLRGNSAVGRSPDGRWNILVRQHNIWVRTLDGEEVQLTDDGSEGLVYDLQQMKESWWSAGVTDLHGLLFKPYDFDPQKKYPVIDAIYGGDHVSLMELFASFDQHGAMGVPARALAQLGYLVVVMDARGTPGRSKEFHDVSHNNQHRHVIPDHVAGIRHLGKTHAFADLDRVGILGVSGGGNMTLLGMLTAPDVLQLAHNLQGNLLMVHGDPHKDDTARMARALIDANKFFDVLPMPGAGHSFTGEDADYWHEVIRRYFDEHLK